MIDADRARKEISSWKASYLGINVTQKLSCSGEQALENRQDSGLSPGELNPGLSHLLRLYPGARNSASVSFSVPIRVVKIAIT